MRIAAFVAVLLASVSGAQGQTREVSGQAGTLGEWELTATLSEQHEVGVTRLTGPLTMRHIGFCSADGPEEKLGELRLQVADPPSVVKATLLIEGTQCTFLGRLAESYDGVLKCPDRRDVPMTLLIQ